VLLNGDFGSPDIDLTNFVVHVASPAGFEWEITAESSNFAVSQIGNFWLATGGPTNSRGIDQSVQIARRSSIAQSFATTPGEEYELSFYYSHNPSTGPAEQAVTVSGNSILFDAIFSHTLANTAGNMMWTLGLATFVADSSLTTLTFAGPDSDAFNLFALDNVAVVSTVVPLPAAVWLFGSALGLLGWVRRKTT
jgi:hypothetical protein